jgi:hypothetical protein
MYQPPDPNPLPPRGGPGSGHGSGPSGATRSQALVA